MNRQWDVVKIETSQLCQYCVERQAEYSAQEDVDFVAQDVRICDDCRRLYFAGIEVGG